MSTPPPIELATAALQDKTLSVQALASTIVAQCRVSVQLAAADATLGGRTEDGDTLGLERYLWNIWFALADGVMEDSSRHDFFADVLVAIKANGNEHREWQIWSQSFDWANLPLWGATVAETMHHGLTPGGDDEGKMIRPYDEKLGKSILAGDTPPDTLEGRGWARARTRWLNYSTFCARRWALDAVEDPHWAMVMVAGYLEPLSLPEHVWRRSKPSSATFPRELGMETGMI